jgi:hypothetical protein
MKNYPNKLTTKKYVKSIGSDLPRKMFQVELDEFQKNGIAIQIGTEDSFR